MAALGESKHPSLYTHTTTPEELRRNREEADNLISVSSVDGKQIIHTEYEDPEFAEQIANWCNGGSNRRRLRITADDIEVLDINGRRLLNTHKRSGDKIGRNEPCPCGSGKKFKKCCGIN